LFVVDVADDAVASCCCLFIAAVGFFAATTNPSGQTERRLYVNQHLVQQKYNTTYSTCKTAFFKNYYHKNCGHWGRGGGRGDNQVS
jgi:hypothetical protein